MCSCVSSVHFVSVFSKLVLLDLVYSVLSPEISWEERLRNEVFFSGTFYSLSLSVKRRK